MPEWLLFFSGGLWRCQVEVGLGVVRKRMRLRSWQWLQGVDSKLSGSPPGVDRKAVVSYGGSPLAH